MPESETQVTHFLRYVEELGVRVTRHHEVRAGEHHVTFDAYLPDFGGQNGMLLLLGGFDSLKSAQCTARNAGLWFSCLNPESPTSRADVQATLDDWGYFGPPQQTPGWYTGRPWTDG